MRSSRLGHHHAGCPLLRLRCPRVGSDAAFEATVGLVIRTLMKAHAKFCEVDLLYGNGGITSGVSLCQSTSITSPSGSSGPRPAPWLSPTGPGRRLCSADSRMPSLMPMWPALVSMGVKRLYIVSVNATPTEAPLAVRLSLRVRIRIWLLSMERTEARPSTSTGTMPTVATWSPVWNPSPSLYPSGSLFGISATSYDLWAANTFACGSSQLTFSKLQQAVALAVSRGLDEEVMALISPVSFADLVNEQPGLAGTIRPTARRRASRASRRCPIGAEWQDRGLAAYVRPPGEGFIVPLPN